MQRPKSKEKAPFLEDTKCIIFCTCLPAILCCCLFCTLYCILFFLTQCNLKAELSFTLFLHPASNQQIQRMYMNIYIYTVGIQFTHVNFSEKCLSQDGFYIPLTIKEANLYSLVMMLKLKLQYFGHLMRRVDSLEKTLMLGGWGGWLGAGGEGDDRG